ncbi:MAG: hypothetical protein ACOCVK_02705 [bacterium]
MKNPLGMMFCMPLFGHTSMLAERHGGELTDDGGPATPGGGS